MSVDLKSISRAEIPIASAFGVSSVVFILLVAAFLHVFGVSLAALVLFVVAAALLWMALRHPMFALGAVLAFMPVYPLAILIGKFFGPAFMMSDVVTACDRIALLLMAGVLWWRNGIKLKTPDWFLLCGFGFALLRLAFGGTLLPLLYDFDLMIAYVAGRVVVLTASQERKWASRAVWIVAVLSVLGLTEVFIIGEGPRTILYLSVADAATEGGTLNGSFRAQGFSGLRESSTMFGPLQFAALCMVALIIWWVYRRNYWTGAVIAVGLVCSVTRSAWLGTVLAIPVLAVAMEQKRRILLYAALALALFIVSIPVVGLGDYLLLTKSGEDVSAQGHQESIFTGLKYVLDHPLGSGPGNVGTFATKSNLSGTFIESTYLTLAGEYGIPTGLCFIGFLVSALRIAWRQRTRLSYTAIGILVGFGAVMMVAPLHNVFSLASWVWFPVGLAVKSSAAAPNCAGGL